MGETLPYQVRSTWNPQRSHRSDPDQPVTPAASARGLLQYLLLAMLGGTDPPCNLVLGFFMGRTRKPLSDNDLPLPARESTG
jgi:hypothetical protein